MIGKVDIETSTFKKAPNKFEAGTPNIAGAIGLAEAVQYLESIGMEAIKKHSDQLSKYAREQLQRLLACRLLAKQGGVYLLLFSMIYMHMMWPPYLIAMELRFGQGIIAHNPYWIT